MDSVDSTLSANETGFLATGGFDSKITLWNPLTGIPTKKIDHEGSQVNRLRYYPRERTLYSAAHGEVRYYDLSLKIQNPKGFFKGCNSNVTDMSFCSNISAVITCDEGGAARLWDARENSRKSSMVKKFDFSLTSLKVHPSSLHVAITSTASKILFWDLKSNSVDFSTFNFDRKYREGISFSSIATTDNDNLMVATSMRRGFLYKTRFKTNSEYYIIDDWDQFATLEAQALNCSFSQDSTRLAVCASDGKVRIYQTSDMSELTLLDGLDPDNWVWDCKFTLDSRFLFTVSSDAMLRLVS